jgi:RNA polymerase sigma-70 factor (ECF subfamily)
MIGITELLIDWSAGDDDALEKLFPLVEKELHRLAHNYMRKLQPGITLQTTAVINETYIRLIDQNKVQWQNRAHFFGIAATMMRRFLLNYIRDNKAQKRGGGAIEVSLGDAMTVTEEKSREILALEEALCTLSKIDGRMTKIVELRYYGGLNFKEIAEILKVSTVTVRRDWTLAKAWLAREVLK